MIDVNLNVLFLKDINILAVSSHPNLIKYYYILKNNIDDAKKIKIYI